MKPRRPTKNTIVTTRRLVREVLVATQRAHQLELYRQFRKSGFTATQAASLCRSSVPSIFRWNRRAAAQGFAGLMPATALCGRRKQSKRRRS